MHPPLIEAYLMEHHAEENLAFWESVEAYRTLDSPVDRLEFANDVYREFIIPHAPAQVNLGHQCFNGVAASLKLAPQAQGNSPGSSDLWQESQGDGAGLGVHPLRRLPVTDIPSLMSNRQSDECGMMVPS